jgi:hypothetical protein
VFSPYMPGVARRGLGTLDLARHEWIIAVGKPGIWGSTVNLSRHNVSKVAIGSPRAPPSTAEVTAPIEIPATAAA